MTLEELHAVNTRHESYETVCRQRKIKHVMGRIDFEKQERECTACRRILHFSSFTMHTDTGKPFSQCRECKNIKNLKYRIKQRDTK